MIEASDSVIFHRYSIGGVEYAAARDVSSLRHLLPGELGARMGPATVKYLPKNPFNSILICEEWAAFRKLERIKEGA